MKKSNKRILARLCLATPLTLAAAAAWAQTPKPAASDVMLDDVVVTAERRETSVREVGFSMVAVGGEVLRKQEVHDPSGLSSLVPGIVLNNTDKSTTKAQIRGNVSTFRTATLDAPISFFADDVYYPYTTDLNLNFYDLNHIEILRGPQGTLFGRNVTGGAIVVKTNDPIFDDDYLVSISGGNAGYLRTEGMLNGVLIADKLAGRIAFSTERSDGLIDRPNLRTKGGGGSVSSARAKLLYTPTDDLSVVLSADYSDYTGDGASSALTPATRSGAAPVLPAELSRLGVFSTKEWTNSDSNYEPNAVLQRGVAAHVDWDVLGGRVTSISSYRGTKTDSLLNNILFAGPPALNYDNHVDNKWFTQEVRFASAPGRISYVVGAFYLNGDYHTLTFLGHEPAVGSALRPSYRILPTIVKRDQFGRVYSSAIFGEGTFKFTEQLSLSVGGRYTVDRKKLDFTATSPTNDPTRTPQVAVVGYTAPIRATAKQTWDAFTPRVTLKYVPNDQINTYITYSKGFKSGGWVDQSYTIAGATLPLPPEDTTNYEAGVKSRLFDSRLDLNVTVFELKTKDLQNFSGAGGIPHSYSGDLRVRGVELESTGRITDAFTLSLNYAYLDAIYTKLVDPATVTAALPGGLNFAGNPAKTTPKNSIQVSGRYVFPLANEATLTAQADYQYSDTYSTQDNYSSGLYPVINDKTEGRNVNARLSYETADKRINLSLWVKNLTNHYKIDYADDVTSFVTTTPGVTYWRVVANNPRSFGVTLTYRK